MTTTNCFVCRAVIPDIAGPVSDQSYLPQSPGCWKLYTEVLAREYGEWKYPDIHRLTVDCYAVQHPTTEPDQKSTQSITVHLVGIYLYLKKNLAPHDITKKIGEIVNDNKGRFKQLDPPENLGDITITNVHKATDLDEHNQLVAKWAESVWEAWEKHQSYVTTLAGFYLT